MYPSYIIHRTSIGCYERTLALLIEKYAGAFPTWLAPTQVKVMSLSERHADYVSDIAKEMEKAGIRVELDTRNEKIGYKIREAQLEKVPYMVVCGDKDIEAGTISVRSRKGGEQESMTLDQFIAKIQKEVAEKTLNI